MNMDDHMLGLNNVEVSCIRRFELRKNHFIFHYTYPPVHTLVQRALDSSPHVISTTSCVLYDAKRPLLHVLMYS